MAACEHLEQVGRIGAAGVFGVELDVVGELPRQLDGVDRHLRGSWPSFRQRLAVALVPELAGDVDIRGADAGVDARPFRALASALPQASMSLGHGAGKGADRGPLDLARRSVDGLEILRRRGGISGLDHVHVERRQLPGDDELLPASKARAGRLFAVPQGGVEHRYFFGHSQNLSYVNACAAVTAFGYARNRSRIPPTWSNVALTSGRSTRITWQRCPPAASVEHARGGEAGEDTNQRHARGRGHVLAGGIVADVQAAARDDRGEAGERAFPNSARAAGTLHGALDARRFFAAGAFSIAIAAPSRASSREQFFFERIGQGAWPGSRPLPGSRRCRRACVRRAARATYGFAPATPKVSAAQAAASSGSGSRSRRRSRGSRRSDSGLRGRPAAGRAA